MITRFLHPILLCSLLLASGHGEVVPSRAKVNPAVARMLDAARQRRPDEVKAALQQGVDLYSTINGVDNVLYYAVFTDQKELTAWLLNEGGFDVRRAVPATENLTIQAGAPGLAIAAYQGYTEVVAELLKRGVNASPDRVPLFNTPLVGAAANRQRAAAKLLLRAGADPTKDIFAEGDALQHFVRNRDLELLALAFEKNPRLSVEHAHGDRRTLLCRAVDSNWIEGVRYLLARRADPYALDNAGKTVFAHAEGNYPMRRALLEGYLEVDSDGSETAKSSIALYLAIQSAEATEFDSLLPRLDAKALNYRTRHGLTPLIFAVGMNAELKVRALLARDVDVDASPEWGSALTFACRNAPAFVRLLLDAGAKPECLGAAAASPLEIAAANGQPDVVSMLLQRGAKVDSPRVNGPSPKTPLMYAAEAGRLENVQLLLDAHASVNALDRDGVSALGYATISDNLDVLQLLIAAGADVQQRNPAGENAATFAMQRGRLKTLRKLTELGVRDETTALRVIAQPRMETQAVVDFLKENYGAKANEAVFWSQPHPLAEVQRYLAEGGDVNFHGESTPLQYAIKFGAFDVAHYLLDRGATVDLTGTDNDVFPLELAASYTQRSQPEKERVRLVDRLLEAGANPNKSNSIWPPLFGAVTSGYLDVARHLLRAGADPRATYRDGDAVRTIFDHLSRYADTLGLEQRAAFGDEMREAIRKLESAPPKKNPSSF